MILRRWPLFSLLAAVLVAVSAGRVTAAAAGNPEDAQILLRQVSTDMLGEIKAQAEQADEARLRAIVERLLIPHVDFRRVSQLVLAKHWRTASDAQRAQFTDEFRNFVVRFYTAALADWLKSNDVPDEPVTFGGVRARPGSKIIEVPSKLRRPDGSDVDIGYRMYWEGGRWQVIDVAVAGISMVTSYRSSFSSQIQQLGVDGLIARLAQKNVEFATAP